MIGLKTYDENKLEDTRDYLKLCYEYPEYSYDWYQLMKARSGYKLGAKVAKAENIVDESYPNYCPCCKNHLYIFTQVSPSVMIDVKQQNIG